MSSVLLMLLVAFVILVIGWMLWRSRFRASEAVPVSSIDLSASDGLALTRQTGLFLDSTVDHGPMHAHYLARACDLAYLRESEASARFRDELNLQARLISVDNTQVYVGENAESIVVAFRGSESPSSLDGFKDWLLTNSRNFLVLPEGRIGTDFAAAGVGARFHRGFMAALEEVWFPLKSTIQAACDRKDRPIWITGHSLGGAIALMAGWRFHQAFLPVHQIVTFGAPMVGNQRAADAYHKEFPGKIFRYVDLSDLVPRMPTISLLSNQYNHVQQEITLGGDQNKTAQSFLSDLAESQPNPQNDSADDAGNDLTNASEETLWREVQTQIESHLMANYIARISDLQSNTIG